ncbi:flagellar biosynthetic protein FliO [Chromatiales bacterium (ex Bugula neritina AB1)]|nr:flagellar biosynthetic protein FliO [Chromatiales bacterium (ex Bugula neritina AB1)]
MSSVKLHIPGIYSQSDERRWRLHRQIQAMSKGLTFIVATLASSAGAQESAVYTQPPGALYFLKLLLVLVFVLGIFLFFAKILRQLNGGGRSSHGSLKVLAGMSLGSRERLVIVQAGNTQMLLGISNSGMAKLHQFDEDIEATGGSENEAQENLKGRFEQILSGIQK